MMPIPPHAPLRDFEGPGAFSQGAALHENAAIVSFLGPTLKHQRRNRQNGIVVAMTGRPFSLRFRARAPAAAERERHFADLYREQSERQRRFDRKPRTP